MSSSESFIARPLARVVLAVLGFVLAAPARGGLWHEDYEKACRLIHSECEQAVALLEKAIRREPKPGLGKLTGVRFQRIDYLPYLALARAHLACNDGESMATALDQARERGVAPDIELSDLRTKMALRFPPIVNDSFERSPRPTRPPAPPPPPTTPPPPPPPPLGLALRFGERLQVECRAACRFINEPGHIEVDGQLERLPSGPVDVRLGEQVVPFETAPAALDDDLRVIDALLDRGARVEIGPEIRKASSRHLLAVLLLVDGGGGAPARRAARARFEGLVASKTLTWQRELNRLLRELAEEMGR